MSIENNDPVQQFNTAGIKASCHYADDTCSEWGLAHKLVAECLDLWERNPDCHYEMEAVARRFLWSVKDELNRKVERECQSHQWIDAPPNHPYSAASKRSGLVVTCADCGYVRRIN